MTRSPKACQPLSMMVMHGQCTLKKAPRPSVQADFSFMHPAAQVAALAALHADVPRPSSSLNCRQYDVCNGPLGRPDAWWDGSKQEQSGRGPPKGLANVFLTCAVTCAKLGYLGHISNQIWTIPVLVMSRACRHVRIQSLLYLKVLGA